MTETVTFSAVERARSFAEDAQPLQGLSTGDAIARLAADGPNELPQERRRGVLKIALEVVRQPMFLMLVAAGSLYLMIGEPTDAMMLLGFVVVVMGITVVQERRTERALEALRDLSSSRALVIRDGVQQRIAGREVVRGDLILLSEGDRVPADALLRTDGNLAADESLLTGESVPVRKSASAIASALDPPGGDELPSLFSGTLVTAGQGMAEVVATGPRTELGKIGKALQTLEREPTPLQQAAGKLVRLMAVVGLGLSALVIVAYALTRGGSGGAWREGAQAGIAMAMAVLPEEFPVILTIFLALGAWRISHRHVLTRRMPAVETLGAVTVLCVDKTGTLTLNQMTLAAIDHEGTSFDVRSSAPVPSRFHRVLEAAVLSSRSDPFDPMERALVDAGRRLLTGAQEERELIREYPLTPQLLAVSQAWRTSADKALLVAAKGAPEAIATLCRLTAPAREELGRRSAQFAAEGLRVLGVAAARIDEEKLPREQGELHLAFLGLVALEDPVRPAVPAAVAECRSAGIRVVMITGDYPATARSIAAQAGIADPGALMTGPELNALSEDEFAARVRSVNVFARVVPKQKLRIVEALKRSGEIVGMTGDGVNDAPALKAAHIGVAMGGRGTDVARESAALVLLDDEFPSIVAAIRLGRRIFDNIKKAFTYTFAVHVPIAGLSVAPLFVPGWPLLLLPVHIVFMELIIDPACSLVFEAEEAEPDVMRRAPRDPREQLFSRAAMGWGLLQGTGVLALALAAFVAVTRMGEPTPAARAVAFTAIVLGNLFLILGNRSRTRSTLSMLREPNATLWWVVGGAAVFLALALFVPLFRGIFHFGAPSAAALTLGIVAGLATLPWVEVLRLLRNRAPRADRALPGTA